MAGRKIFLIGISGATNSGKTSLCSKLRQGLPKIIKALISQDTYFYDPGDERLVKVPELQVENYEVISSLDMEKMVKEIKELKEKFEQCERKTTVILVEGFTIYAHKPLCDLLDKKYFLTVTEDVCRERRRHRDYIPADIPGYFDKVVWPSYVDYLDQDVKTQQDIVYLDGNQDQDKAYETILMDIENLHRTLLKSS